MPSNNMKSLRTGTKDRHEKIGHHLFLQRYKGSITLIEHYLHLRQLQAIYEALESEEKNTPILETLPEALKYLLKRSEEIKKDLAYIEKFIPIAQRNIVFPYTEAYVAYLKRQDGPGKQESKILVHLLIRIFGDLFGGQRIKEKLAEIFNQKKLLPENGTHFYTFKPGTLFKLSIWFNSLKLNMEEFVRESLTAFDKHDPIFNDLENHVANLPRPSRCGMFAFKAAAAVALLAVGAGLTIAHSSAFKR